MASSIPRGIRVIDWKNADKTKSIRYRVRVERGDFVVDRSFGQDELERAKIFLADTKTPQGRLLIAQGRDRATLMVDEVHRAGVELITEAFKVIPRVDERVFHYKIEGFKTVFRRVLERAKLDGIHMHDTRRSFISRVLKDITSSPVAIADMIGARSVANLQKRTIERIRQCLLVSYAS